MTNRTRTVTSFATSGPGRMPGSDGRSRARARARVHARARGRVRRQAHDGHAATAPRRRAEALFDGTGAFEAFDGTAAYAMPPPPGAAPAAAGPAAPETGTETGTASAEPRGARERWWPALRDRLPLWLQLRCGVEPRALAALAVVLVVAALVAGRYFWAGRPEAVHAPEVVGAAEPAAAPTPGTAGPPVPTASPPAVVVDVSGKVRRPGVLRLPAGSRVADALHAAGGVRPGTDVSGLNRARVLMDGEQVLVGVTPAPAGPVSGSGPGGASGQAGAAGAGPVSLNTATVEQLDALPGVGPVLAQHIVDYRTRHGGFRSVDELREVNGIGDRRFSDLQPLVRP
ncbi:ComEA family DNA-binding protein [Streptomyces sp. NPDC045431]|uniref:ComEA family DNA-binding protein n=1 Tax=Streptomyces sp. NPDC045431 TaxID=3155613 RepID=UPI0033D40475